MDGRLPERTNGAASKAVVASGSPWVQIPYLPQRSAAYRANPGRRRFRARSSSEDCWCLFESDLAPAAHDPVRFTLLNGRALGSAHLTSPGASPNIVGAPVLRFNRVSRRRLGELVSRVIVRDCLRRRSIGTDTSGNSVGRLRYRPVRRIGGVLVALAVLFNGLGPAAAQEFVDVPAGAFYETPVEWLVNLQITTGTSEETFSPDDRVSRGQMAAFLWRYAGEPAGFVHSFQDVPTGAFYDSAVGWLAATAITTGVGPGRYGPDDFVTRGQMAAFLWRFAGSPATSTHGFGDVPTGAFYDSAVGWLAATAITTGVGPGRYGPDDFVTRGQMAAFLYRLRAHVVPAPRSLYLVDLPDVSGQTRSPDPVIVSGVTYGDTFSYRHNGPHTVGVVPHEFNVPVGMESFRANAALTDDSNSSAWLNFEVWVDGQLVTETQQRFGDPKQSLVADVSGASRILIRSTRIADVDGVVAWIGARFSTEPAVSRPTSPTYTWLRWMDAVQNTTTRSNIFVASVPYTRSVWSRSPSTASPEYPLQREYNLPLGITRFEGSVGLGDSSGSGASRRFKIITSSGTVFDVVVVNGETMPFDVPVTGGTRITLWSERVTNVTAYPAWLNAKFETP